MDPIIANAVVAYPRTAVSSRTYRPALTGIVLLCVILGSVLVVAALNRPSFGTAAAGGVAVTDGWAHSPITRLGAASGASAGVDVTDGWAHSPITRTGGTDARDAMLRQLAVSYVEQDPAAEARSR
jgi:hypothetical protein